jgi:hypothetical protein
MIFSSVHFLFLCDIWNISESGSLIPCSQSSDQKYPTDLQHATLKADVRNASSFRNDVCKKYTADKLQCATQQHYYYFPLLGETGDRIALINRQTTLIAFRRCLVVYLAGEVRGFPLSLEANTGYNSRINYDVSFIELFITLKLIGPSFVTVLTSLLPMFWKIEGGL